jgi:hypothetical protein
MITALIDYIGLFLHLQNPYFDHYKANCIQDKEGRILYDMSAEKEYEGIQDTCSKGFYLRFNGEIRYETLTPKFSSCSPSYSVIIPIRFVGYSTDENNAFDIFKLERKLRSDLQSVDLTGYTGEEQSIKIKILNSLCDTNKVWDEEFINKERREGGFLNAISFDFEVQFQSNYEPCLSACYPILKEGENVDRCSLILAILTQIDRNSCILPTYDFSDPYTYLHLTSQQIDDITSIFCPMAVKINTGPLVDGTPVSIAHGIVGFTKFGFVVSSSVNDVLPSIIRQDPANPNTKFEIQIDGDNLPLGLDVTIIPAI